jgi:hypothetical protein
MMITFLRLFTFALAVIIPGGFLLLPLYLAFRTKRGTQLDFAGGHRRVPHTRTPPPQRSRLRRTLRKMSGQPVTTVLG